MRFTRIVGDSPTVLLSECGELAEVNSTYWIKIDQPQSPYLVLVMGYELTHPAGAQFQHPSIVRSRKKLFEFKHSNASGHKWWTQSHGIQHVFVVPRLAIRLRLIETSSYPEIEIGGHVIVLNTSGGTFRSGWADFLDVEVETAINHSMEELQAVAAAAVRGTAHEPFVFWDEEPKAGA